MATTEQNQKSRSCCIVAECDAVNLRPKRPHFFSKGLSFGFSKSLSATSNVLSSRNSANSSSPPASSGDCPSNSSSVSAHSSVSDASSTSSSKSSGSGKEFSPRFHSKRPTCVFGKGYGFKRSKCSNDRSPVLLDKIPSGKSAEYMTVYVGARSAQRVKYVISRNLLSHHLFQVLLKCSEDEFGEDYTVKGGVAVICDPALFLQVVRVVDESMQSQRKLEAQTLDTTYDSDV